MNTYKVVCSQLVWYETFIKADSEEEAEEMVQEDQGDIEWTECGTGDFEIDDIDEVSHDR
jgi:hypothetical protein